MTYLETHGKFDLSESKMELEVGQQTVQSLVSLHGRAGWPGCIHVLVAKTVHFWFQQDEG